METVKNLINAYTFEGCCVACTPRLKLDLEVEIINKQEVKLKIIESCPEHGLDNALILFPTDQENIIWKKQ
jgi:hypothetical protein